MCQLLKKKKKKVSQACLHGFLVGLFARHSAGMYDRMAVRTYVCHTLIVFITNDTALRMFEHIKRLVYTHYKVQPHGGLH